MAKFVERGHSESPCLAMDTVFVRNGVIFGKPIGRQEGFGMHSTLAGNRHIALPAVVLSTGKKCRVSYPSQGCGCARFRGIKLNGPGIRKHR